MSISWNVLTSVEEVDEVFLASNERPQVIYKHSNSCGVCYMAKHSLDKLSEDEGEKAMFYIVDVIRDRPISKYISERSGVRHESPQILLLKDGEVKWNSSHFGVKRENLIRELEVLNA